VGAKDSLEQPRVFDGNDGLVGEGLEQFNQSIGEWPGRCPADGNCADGLAFMDKRHGQYGSVAKMAGAGTALWVFISLGLNIGNVDRLLFEHNTAGDKPADYRQRTALGYRPMVGDEAQTDAVHLKDRSVIGIAKTNRARPDFCEDGLQVRLRA